MFLIEANALYRLTALSSRLTYILDHYVIKTGPNRWHREKTKLSTAYIANGILTLLLLYIGMGVLSR